MFTYTLSVKYQLNFKATIKLKNAIVSSSSCSSHEVKSYLGTTNTLGLVASHEPWAPYESKRKATYDHVQQWSKAHQQRGTYMRARSANQTTIFIG